MLIFSVYLPTDRKVFQKIWEWLWGWIYDCVFMWTMYSRVYWGASKQN